MANNIFNQWLFNTTGLTQANEKEYKPIDYSQGAYAGQFGQRYGINPVDVRQAQIAEATQRRQSALGMYAQEKDELNTALNNQGMGKTIPQSADYVKAQTPEKRLENYLQGKGDDPEFAFILNNSDVNYIEAKFGPNVANYAQNIRREKTKQAQFAGAITRDSDDTGSVGSALLGGIAKGSIHIRDAVMNTKDFLTLEGNDLENSLSERKQDTQKQLDAISRWQGDEYSSNDARKNDIQNIAEFFRQQKYLETKASTGNEELARKSADELAEEMYGELSYVTHETMLNGLGEQGPQIALAIAFGGAGAGIAQMTAMGISRTSAAQIAGQVSALTTHMNKIKTLGSMIGVGIEAGIQDGTSAAQDAYLNTMDYLRHNPDKALAKREELKKLYPELNDEEIMHLIASEASSDAGLTSGLYTGISAGLASPIFTHLMGNRFTGLASTLTNKQKLLLGMSSPVIEGGTEFGEEYVNIVAPKYTTNTATNEEVYRNPFLYALEQAKEAGTIGALSAGGSVVSSLGSMKLPQTSTDNKSTDTDDTQDTNDLKVNVYGSEAKKDVDGNIIQPAVEGLINGKSMENSVFGDTYRRFFDENIPFAGRDKSLESDDYEETLFNYREKIINNDLPEYQAERAKAPNQQDAVKLASLITNIDTFTKFKSDLLDALYADIDSVVQDGSLKLNELLIYREQLNQVKTDPLMPDAVRVIKENDLNQEIQRIENELNQVPNFVANLDKLLTSRLIAIIGEDYSVDLSQIKPTKLDVKDKLKDMNLLPNAVKDFDGVLNMTNDISDNITNILSQINQLSDADPIILNWLDATRNAVSLELKNANNVNTSDRFINAYNKIKDNLLRLDKDFSTQGVEVNKDSFVGKLIDFFKNYQIDGNKQAKVFLEKFFDSKKGILSYLDNNGKFSIEGRTELLKFKLSQDDKYNALKKVIQDNVFPVTDIPLTWTKGVLQQSDKTPVAFKDESSAEAYLKAVEKDKQLFDSLYNALVSDTLNPAGITKINNNNNPTSQPINPNSDNNVEAGNGNNIPVTPSNPNPSTEGNNSSTDTGSNTDANNISNESTATENNDINESSDNSITPSNESENTFSEEQKEENKLSYNLVKDSTYLTYRTFSKETGAEANSNFLAYKPNEAPSKHLENPTNSDEEFIKWYLDEKNSKKGQRKFIKNNLDKLRDKENLTIYVKSDNEKSNPISHIEKLIEVLDYIQEIEKTTSDLTKVHNSINEKDLYERIKNSNNVDEAENILGTALFPENNNNAFLFAVGYLSDDKVFKKYLENTSEGEALTNIYNKVEAINNEGMRLIDEIRNKEKEPESTPETKKKEYSLNTQVVGNITNSRALKAFIKNKNLKADKVFTNFSINSDEHLGNPTNSDEDFISWFNSKENSPQKDYIKNSLDKLREDDVVVFIKNNSDSVSHIEALLNSLEETPIEEESLEEEVTSSAEEGENTSNEEAPVEEEENKETREEEEEEEEEEETNEEKLPETVEENIQAIVESIPSDLSGDASAKGLLKAQVVTAFNNLKKRYESNKNKLSPAGKLTIENWGLFDDIVKDVGVSQKTINLLYHQGVNILSDELSPSLTQRETGISKENVLDIVTNYFNHVTSNTTSWFSELDNDSKITVLKVLKSDIKEEDINTLLSPNEIKSTTQTVETIFGIYRKLYEEFLGDANRLFRFTPITGTKSNIVSLLPKITASSEYLMRMFDSHNYSDEERGKEFSSFLLGLSKSLFDFVGLFHRTGSVKPAVMRDYFNNNSVYPVEIYETTLNSFSSNYFTASDDYIRVTDKESFYPVVGNTTPLSKINITQPFDDYSFLGLRSEIFVKKAGSILLENLGLDFKENTPKNVKESVIQSFGGELVALLHSHNLLTSNSVEFINNEEQKANRQLRVKTEFLNFLPFNTRTSSISYPMKLGFEELNSRARSGKGMDTEIFTKSTNENYQDYVKGLKEINLNQNVNAHKNPESKKIIKSTSNNWVYDVFYPSLLNANNKASVVLGTEYVQESQTYFIRDSREPLDLDKEVLNKKVISTNPAIAESIKNHNAQPFKLSKDNYNLLKHNENVWLITNGYIFKEEMPIATDTYRQSVESTNNQVIRARDFAMNVVKQMEEGAGIEHSVIHFLNEDLVNTRIQQLGGNNPQSIKPIREMFLTDFRPLNKEDFKTKLKELGNTYGLNTDDFNVDSLPIFSEMVIHKDEAYKNISKAKVNKKIERLINYTNSLFNSNNSEASAQLEHRLSFILGLAQALGVKIEKKTFETIAKELQSIFNDNPYLDEIVKTLVQLHKSPETKIEDTKPFIQLRDDFGNGSPRAYSALNALAHYFVAKEGETVELNFYLEADGISNGLANFIRQFNLGFTEEFSNLLLQTGQIPFEHIVAWLNKQGVKTVEDLDKEENRDLIVNITNHLEGSAHIFENEKIKDIYESVAEKIEKSFLDGIQGISFFNNVPEDSSYKNLIEKSIQDFIQENGQEFNLSSELNVDNFDLAHLISHLNPIISKAYSRLTKIKDKETKNKARTVLNNFANAIKSLGLTVFLDSVKITSSDKQKTLLDFLKTPVKELHKEDIKIIVKRSLSKIGVTPVSYGGATTGVANQFTNDVMKKLQEFLNEMLKYQQEVLTKDNLTKEEKDKYTDMKNTLLIFIRTVGFNFGSYGYNLLDKDPNFIKRLSKDLVQYKREVLTVIKNSFAVFLYDGVKDVFGTPMQVANSAVSVNNVVSNLFAIEAREAYLAQVETRNKRMHELYKRTNGKKGWSEIDPRNLDALTTKEEKSVISKLLSYPVFANGMSADAKLLDDLVKEGTVILNERVVDNPYNSISVSSSLEYENDSFQYGKSGNHVNTFVYKMKHIYKVYASGGATIFTNNVVSTESRVQAMLTNILTTLGTNAHNVFDGSDAFARLRLLIGYIANKTFAQNHEQTNLPEAFFHQLNKNSLYELISKITIDKGNALKVLDSQEELSPDENNLIHITLDKDTALFLDLINSLLHTRIYAEKEDHIHFTEIREGLNKVFYEILSGNSEGTFVIPKDRLEAYREVIKNKVLDSQLTFHDSLIKGAKNLYNNTLVEMQDYVAESYANKELEKEYFMTLYNQFGGSNRGYLSNKDILEKEDHRQVLNDLLAYVEKRDVTQIGLEDFIKNNEILSKFKEEKKKEKLKQLPLNKIVSDINLTDNKIVISDKASLLEYIKNSVKDSNDIFENTVNTLIPIFEKHLSNDLKVITDIDALEKEISIDRSDILKIRGRYYPTKNIVYINLKKPEPNRTAVHELIHAVITKGIFDYYESEKTNFQDKTVDADLMGVIQKLEATLHKFTETYEQNPVVQELVKEYEEKRQTGNSRIQELYSLAASKYSIKDTITAAKIIFFKNETDSFSRAIILNEFIAYALTANDLLTSMYYRNQAYPSIKNKSLFDSIKTRLINLFKEVKTNLSNFFYGNVKVHKAEQRIVEESMLFDVFASVDYLGQHNQTSTSKVNLDMVLNSYDISSHDKYLVELSKSLNDSDLVRSLNIPEWTQEKSFFNNYLAQSQFSNALKDYVKDIRRIGVSINQNEEDAFILMNAVYEFVLEKDSSFKLLGEKIVKSFVENKNKENDDGVISKVINGNNYKLSTTLALLSTVKEFKDSLELYPNTESLMLNLINKALNYTAYLKSNPNVKSIKEDTNSVEKLALAVFNYNFHNQLSLTGLAQLMNKDVAEINKLRKSLDWVKNLTKPLPDNMAQTVNLVATELTTNPNNFIHHDRQDSIIGNKLTEFLEKVSATKNYPTWLNGFGRLILQAREKTHYIYDMRSRFIKSIESSREIVRQVLPKRVMDTFKKGYSKEIDEVISRTVIYPDLAKLFLKKKVSITALKSIVKDRHSIDLEIDSAFQNIRKNAQRFGFSNVEHIMNFFRWQVQGLGDMMMNREAKKDKNGYSHHILPNVRVIASLKHLLPKLSDRDIEDHISLFEEDLSTLASLYALKQVSDKDLNSLNRLLDEERDGMRELLKLQKSSTYIRKNTANNLLGYDGYVHSQKDSNTSLEIVYKTNKKRLDELKQLGYENVHELEDGKYIVMKSRINPLGNYQTGIIGLTTYSTNGADFSSLEPLNAVSQVTTIEPKISNAHFADFAVTVRKAMRTPDYYEKLTEKSSVKPVIDIYGSIAKFSVEIPHKISKQLVNEIDTGIESLGNIQGRVYEEMTTITSNKENIDILNNHYQKAHDKQNYVLLDGKQVTKTNNSKEREFINRLNQFYHSLPLETQIYLDNIGGVYLYRNEIDNLIGYRQIDITDLWRGKSKITQAIRHTLEAVFKIFGLVGFKPIEVIKMSQDGLKEVVSAGKDIILNKSIIVAIGNLISNVIHLVNHGIPPATIVREMEVGLRAIEQYNQNSRKLVEINWLLKHGEIEAHLYARLQAEKIVLEKAIENSPIKDLVDAGIFSSIAGAAGYEKQFDTNDAFTYKTKLLNSLGLNKKISNIEKTKAGKHLSNFLILKGSKTHDFMVKSLDYGDFVAKYVLYKHLINQKRFTKKMALNVIREEFINYTMNRGRVFDYLNVTGLTWFASYAMGIQKIIYKMLRRNFLGTMAIYTAGTVSNPYDGLGLIGTVPEQNLLQRSWDYTTSPSNIFQSFDGHWFERALGVMF